MIEVSALEKRYGDTTALDGVSSGVGRGEIVGFLGPNGAGKTTTLRILLGLLRKDGGTVTLLGGDPWRDAVTLHRRLAYVPGDVNLWPNLSGGEVIDLLARLRGDFDQSRRDELVERFKLDPTRQCRTYSKGNKQKVALIAALVSNVELLILDEPTLGLDPLMEAIFRECVTEARGAGTTVLLSSHILSEVEALCDRISIINEGRIVETGSLAELRHLTRTTVSVEARRPITGLERLPGVYNLTVEGAHAGFSVDADAVNRVLRYLTQFDVRALTSAPPTLEDLFLRHYKLKEGVTR